MRIAAYETDDRKVNNQLPDGRLARLANNNNIGNTKTQVSPRQNILLKKSAKINIWLIVIETKQTDRHIAYVIVHPGLR